MKQKIKRIHPCSQCIVLPMCTKECPISYSHDLTIYTSYALFMVKFSRRQEYKSFTFGFTVGYNEKLLKHFFKNCHRKIKNENKFLIEEVDEIIFYRKYIRAKEPMAGFIFKSIYSYSYSSPMKKNGGVLYSGAYS